MAQDDATNDTKKPLCGTCGNHGTIWDPRRRTGWPRSVSCPTCDGWNKAKAAVST